MNQIIKPKIYIGNDFYNATIKNITFEGCVFKHCMFYQTQFNNVTFYNCKFLHTFFKLCDLPQVAFEQTHLFHVYFYTNKEMNMTTKLSTIIGSTFSGIEKADIKAIRTHISKSFFHGKGKFYAEESFLSEVKFSEVALVTVDSAIFSTKTPMEVMNAN